MRGRWGEGGNRSPRSVSPSPYLPVAERASVGIRTRDPHLTKMVRYHCATEAGGARCNPDTNEIIGSPIRLLEDSG